MEIHQLQPPRDLWPGLLKKQAKSKKINGKSMVSGLAGQSKISPATGNPQKMNKFY